MYPCRNGKISYNYHNYKFIIMVQGRFFSKLKLSQDKNSWKVFFAHDRSKKVFDDIRNDSKKFVGEKINKSFDFCSECNQTKSPWKLKRQHFGLRRYRIRVRIPQAVGICLFLLHRSSFHKQLSPARESSGQCPIINLLTTQIVIIQESSLVREQV